MKNRRWIFQIIYSFVYSLLIAIGCLKCPTKGAIPLLDTHMHAHAHKICKNQDKTSFLCISRIILEICLRMSIVFLTTSSELDTFISISLSTWFCFSDLLFYGYKR